MSKHKKTDPMTETQDPGTSSDPFAQTDPGGSASGAGDHGAGDQRGTARDEAERASDSAHGVDPAETADHAWSVSQDGADGAQSPEERIQELESRLKLAMAEQENLRKRMEREKADVAKYAMANFAREVLGIADNIQRAIDAVPKDAAQHDAALKTFLEGIEVTERELHKAMEQHGIAKLSPEGEKFDPNYHQAMFEIPTSDTPSGIVMQVVQPGYMLADRVLRPAMVGVSKAAPAGRETNDESGGEPEQKPASEPRSDQAKPEDTAKHGAASATPSGSDPEAGAPGDDHGQSQQRGASRLNEPVINSENEKQYET